MQDVDQIDILRELMRFVTQFLIDAEAAEKIGAERYERTDVRMREKRKSTVWTWSNKRTNCAIRSG